MHRRILLTLFAALLTLTCTVNIASAINYEQTDPNTGTPEVHGTSIDQNQIEQKNTNLELDELKAQITSMQRKLNNGGADFTDEILIFLVIILSILSLRTEVKFQQLADTYDKLKNTILRNTITKKIKQKNQTKIHVDDIENATIVRSKQCK
jgi:hypothetical protein